jgi:dTDP-4-amino-4,6-dideoxygalactose transaminase
VNPYAVTKQFERMLGDYTCAPYVVAVNSGTAALLLSAIWFKQQGYQKVTIPCRTYVSVPMALKQAGYEIDFEDVYWRGVYQIKPTPIWDCARRLTSGMYRAGQFQFVSFATNKILGIEQGGAILHDNPLADIWFRKMRFDGRTEGVDPREDHFDVVGHHCIMLPSISAQLILKLHHLPKVNEDLPDYEYPDLSKAPVFA